MRFLKLVLFHGSRGKTSVDFKGNQCIIDASGDSVLRNAPDALKSWIKALAVGRHGEPVNGVAGSELNAEGGVPLQEYKFISDGKKNTVYARDGIHGNLEELLGDKGCRQFGVPGFPDLFTPEEMILLTVHDPEAIEQGNDPLYSGKRLSSILVKKEMAGIRPLFINGIENFAPAIEKELNTLSREIQLLELRKMKNDKLKKEIAHSSRNISRLNRQAESFEKYKSVLVEIKKKNENRDKLSHRISEIRKDILELKDIGEKIHSLEKDLKKRFPQFYNETSEGLPDMDRIQELFNSVRDINEKIDLFSQKKRYMGEKILKGAIALLIFVFLSSVFIIIKSITAGVASIKPLLFITAVSVLASAGGIACYFRIRKQVPAALLETKTEREAELLELLHKNNVPVYDFKTGELYEFLFQYFEDFITFRDIRNELVDLRKKISSTVAYTEKEKKLDSLKSRVEEADAEIREMLAGLDSDVHPVPELAGTDHLIDELNEKIAETGSKIIHEKSIKTSLEEQLGERSEPEENLLEIEAEISGINRKMDELRSEAGAVKLLEDTFREISGPFIRRRREEFSSLLDITLQRLAPGRKDDALAEFLDYLYDEKQQLPSLDINTKCIISMAVRCALSAFFGELELPPLVFVEPFVAAGNENVEESGKILLELCGTRQVIIFRTAN